MESSFDISPFSFGLPGSDTTSLISDVLGRLFSTPLLRCGNLTPLRGFAIECTTFVLATGNYVALTAILFKEVVGQALNATRGGKRHVKASAAERSQDCGEKNLGMETRRSRYKHAKAQKTMAR